MLDPCMDQLTFAGGAIAGRLWLYTKYNKTWWYRRRARMSRGGMKEGRNRATHALLDMLVENSCAIVMVQYFTNVLKHYRLKCQSDRVDYLAVVW